MVSTLTLIFNSHFSPELQIHSWNCPGTSWLGCSHAPHTFFYHSLLPSKLSPPEPLMSISGITILTAAVPLWSIAINSLTYLRFLRLGHKKNWQFCLGFWKHMFLEPGAMMQKVQWCSNSHAWEVTCRALWPLRWVKRPSLKWALQPSPQPPAILGSSCHLHHLTKHPRHWEAKGSCRHCALSKFQIHKNHEYLKKKKRLLYATKLWGGL